MSDNPDGEGGMSGGESALAHLAKPDHWTFLLAMGLVAANVAVGSRYISLAALALLGVALVYDLYEFHTRA